MALTKKDETKISSKVFAWLSLWAAIAVLVIGVVGWQTGKTMVSEVNASMKEQKLFFPPAGSPGFSAEAFPAAQKYAGKQVDDGEKAKAYADDYLGVQLKLISGGKTSSEIGAQAAMDPENAQLQQLQATMFQLETSKGMLLADSYGAWSQGMALQTAGTIGMVLAAVLLAASAYHFARYKKA